MSALLESPRYCAKALVRISVAEWCRTTSAVDRLSKEQVRALYLMHDLFSHSLSSSRHF